MKKISVFLVLVCCLLTSGLAGAKAHAPAKHPAAQKAPADSRADGPAETVETPGKVIKEPNAFNGIKWGTPMAAIPDLTVAEKDGQAAYATSQGVVYRIGEVFLTNVVYAFCQDKFAAVMVEYKGRKAYDSIRKFLSEKYTKPVEIEGKSDDVGWPIGNVLIRMEFSAPKDAGTLSYFYQPLYTPCSGQDGEAPK